MQLSIVPNKDIKHDIKVFEEKIKNKKNFTFSKYADGEWAVMKNKSIDNKEFWFDGNNVLDSFKRGKLIESFKYHNPNYYVGVSCPCCQGLEVHSEMIKGCQQDDDHITWANLWVNDNYSYFKSNILPLFKDRDVVLYAHKDGKFENLPFKPMQIFPVEKNAWNSNWNFVQESKHFINNNSIENALFLFCCGPFGNVLAHELTSCCPQNTYLDIGSTLNPYLQSEGFVRDYYVEGSFFSQMQCQWNNER